MSVHEGGSESVTRRRSARKEALMCDRGKPTCGYRRGRRKPHQVRASNDPELADWIVGLSAGATQAPPT
jgi:hypothetical protein